MCSKVPDPFQIATGPPVRPKPRTRNNAPQSRKPETLSRKPESLSPASLRPSTTAEGGRRPPWPSPQPWHWEEVAWLPPQVKGFNEGLGFREFFSGVPKNYHCYSLVLEMLT